MSDLDTQPVDLQPLTESEKFFKIFSEAAHRLRPLPRRRPRVLKPYADIEQIFSQWEVMFLCTIVNSTHINQGRERRIYWCTYEELIFQFGEEVYKQLKLSKAIDVWDHQDGFTAVTLTPWCASVLGFRIAEYWVRHIERVEEFRGVGRRMARIRVQRWDTESYWTYRERPEKPVRIPGNTCELPLIGDPEDKSYQEDRYEYLEDWQTFTFTKNPRKAISLTIRVGSFAHQITIQRDNKRKKTHQSKKKRKRHVPAPPQRGN